MLESISVEAVRVLGVLIEKSLSTPEYYPMTLNAIRNACNQKSNRYPVVTFSETDVITALDELQHLSLTGHASGGGSRAMKYRHALVEKWTISTAECAVLSCLFVRGAQTVGEIKGRTGRLYDFDSLSDIEVTLDSLGEREHSLVRQIGRQPGQKENRYIHLLSGDDDASHVAAPTNTSSVRIAASGPESRVEGDLRAELEELRNEVSSLRKEFETFREQFD